ncbi:UDP-N-acetylmuramate--L-alanine ligase [Eggerthellaceae bacterium zg-997]|nr:UDP-N-acetylmuramate--L-alanine ligase [Eggerthellaceae bacterium zg-997]
MVESKIGSVHFIGIGGVGMSGIARVAHDQGMRVSGSDIKESRYTRALRDAGVEVFIGHDAANLGRGDACPDVVVVSTAVLDENPELMAARSRGIVVWHRARMLAHLGVGLQTLAVAGTHGKTTTSSMLASTLDDLGLDPTFLIGGTVCAYGTNAHSGTGAHYVVEADESDKSFTNLSPHAVLVTNVEADHLDHYRDLAEIEERFAAFIGLVPADGVVVACGDDPRLMKVARASASRVVSYGFAPTCDVRIESYEPQGITSRYTLRLADGRVLEGSLPQNPGRHNVSNAAGVVALVEALGLDAAQAVGSLTRFCGVKRRFDLVGQADGVTVVDDYAHHPTEIASTVSAAAELGYRRVHVLFQPHRYSRISLFADVMRDEFAHAFDRADTVTFMDVYSAGETPVPGVNGRAFMNVVLESPDHPPAEFVPHRIDTVAALLAKVGEGDLLITMGAGDVTAMGPLVVEALRQRVEERGAR